MRYIELKTYKVDWQTKKLIDKVSQLMRIVDWQGKSIDKESSLTRKVDWQRKLFDKESQLTRKVDWWEKLMNLGYGHRWTNGQTEERTTLVTIATTQDKKS